MIKLLYIDLFCGAGGTTTGVKNARINNEPCALVVACINHDYNAIRSHRSNNKQILHFTEDITKLYTTNRMNRLVKHVEYMRSLYPDAKVVLDASLECTNFSIAKGGQSREADSRTLANHLFPYIDLLRPDIIQIENVKEFMTWGPLIVKVKKDRNGYQYCPCDVVKKKDRIKMGNKYLLPVMVPDPDKKCIYYNEWKHKIEKTYKMHFEHRLLNSADFAALTSRTRFFGQFVPIGEDISWPEPTHSKNPKNDLFGKPLKKWKAVKEVLDFSDEGQSIFDRKKPPVDPTNERIYAGLVKFVAGGKKEFLVKYNSMSQQKKYVAPDLDDPCPVVSTQGRLSLGSVTFMTKYFSGNPENKVLSIDQPAGCITTVDHHNLVNAEFIASYYGNGDNVASVNGPCPTLRTKDSASLIQTSFIDQQYGKSKPASIAKPSGSITTNPKYNLVTVKPFIMNQYTGGGKVSSIHNPCPSVSTVPKQNLISCTPWIMNTNYSNIGSSIEDPAQTITANRKWHYLLNPQYASAGSSVNNPCFTLIARMDKAPPSLIEVSGNLKNIPSFIRIHGNQVIYMIYESDSEIMVKIKEFMALYGIIDIKMRMLRIPELKMIMGFPREYILIGTQADQKKFIGNAVETNMQKAITEATARGILLKQKAA